MVTTLVTAVKQNKPKKFSTGTCYTEKDNRMVTTSKSQFRTQAILGEPEDKLL